MLQGEELTLDFPLGCLCWIWMSVYHGASASLMMPLALISLGRDTALEPSWALQATCCSGRASGPFSTPLFTLNGQLTICSILATDIKIQNGYFVTSWWPVECLGRGESIWEAANLVVIPTD